jgi:hypothetical protein
MTIPSSPSSSASASASASPWNITGGESSAEATLKAIVAAASRNLTSSSAGWMPSSPTAAAEDEKQCVDYTEARPDPTNLLPVELVRALFNISSIFLDFIKIIIVLKINKTII